MSDFKNIPVIERDDLKDFDTLDEEDSYGTDL